ncbi:MAG: SsrA-binding protein SmpB [Bacteriovoracales bacterium]|nr:SsrA-binding protein SmpB [Bacteriovoracales bacterium]
MGIKIIANNKRATYDYFVRETYEAGLSLRGSEVKGLWAGKAQISQAFVVIDGSNEAWAHNMGIPHYEFANRQNHPEMRPRKLLLHKKEILKIKERCQKEDLTIIVLKVYFKKSYVKMEIALAKGKKKHDKRQAMREKEGRQKIRDA